MAKESEKPLADVIPKLIVIVGPTASGKTALAMDLAIRFKGEIICADSRTVYRGLDIGTAKPTLQDRSKVRHHLLDVVSPDESFTVADFKQKANDAIADIASRGKLPILAGGSGLYIDSILFDYSFSSDTKIRDSVNPRHAHRSVAGSRKNLRDNTLIIGLDTEPEILKERISKRVDQMVRDGFIGEVRDAELQYPNSKALHAPGYKAFLEYLRGEKTLDEAKSLFIHNDIRLAKRQKTWFRRNKSIQWALNRDEVVELTTTFLNKIT